MKILKILLIAILVLFIFGGVVAVVFIKTFNIDKYKPQIIAAAKDSLHRDVDFTDMDLDVSLKEGVNLNLKELSISEDAGFGGGKFLSVNEVSLGVDILSFLTRKQVQISLVRIKSPQMTIIRKSSGEMNVQTIAQPQGSDSSAPAASVRTENKNQSTDSLPPVFIDAVEIDRGTFTFIDQSSAPERKITVSELGFKVDHFSFKDPFSFSSQGSLFSAESNFKLTGQAQINPSTNEVKIQNMVLSADLSKLILEDLKRSLVLSKETPMPIKLGGVFETSIKNLTANAQGLSSISLDVSLVDGTVVLQNVSPGVSVDLSQIQLKVTDFSLTDFFPFSLAAAVYSDQTNLNVRGNVKVDSIGQTVMLRNTTVFSDLSYLSFEKMKGSLVMLKDVELPSVLQGKLNLEIAELTADATGLKTLSLDGDLSQGSAQLKDLAVPLGLETKFSATATDLNVPDFNASLGKGTINGKLNVTDYAVQQNFSADIKIDGVDLAEVMDQTDKPVKVEGLVDGHYTLAGQGFDPEMLKKTLSGEGSLDIKKGVLKDINLLNLVLSKLSMFPNIVSEIQTALPPRYKDKLTQKDTILNRVNIQTKILDGAVTLDPVDVDADGFLFKALGKYALDQQFSIQGSFFIPEDLAASMITAVKKLEYLLNEQKQIQIPVAIMGKLPGQIQPSVDLEYIGKRVLRNVGKEEINNVLDKVFDRGGENQGEGTTDPQNPPEERPEGQIIDNILDSIFK